MGGNKPAQIAGSALLRSYATTFEDYLMAVGGTRLMVVGYGFRDDHINDALAQSATNERLHMWLMNPSGRDVFKIPGTDHAIGGPQYVVTDAVRNSVEMVIQRDLVPSLTTDRATKTQLDRFRFSFDLNPA